MNDPQLLELVAATDLFGPETPLPDSTWTRSDALREIERRFRMDTHEPGNTAEDTPSESGRANSAAPRRRWSGAWMAAAAFAVIVIVVGGVAALVSTSNGAADVASTTPVEQTTIPDINGAAIPPETAQPSTPEQDALAKVDAYFAAYEAGDVEAMLDLFTADATFAGYGLDPQNFPSGVDRDVFEEIHAAKAALGEVPTQRECSVVENQTTPTSVTILCDYTTTNVLLDSVGAPPIPFLTRFIVTPIGLTSINDSGGEGDVYDAFALWMSDQHPEDGAAVASGIRLTFAKWGSVDAARHWGNIHAQYADEWAAYLAENGCTYDGPCEP